MRTFKSKFFGSKHKKEQVVKCCEFVQANSQSEVEIKLHAMGYVKINSLKIREE